MSLPIIKNLRLSFSIVITLLVITSIASFLSINLLLEASELIDRSNHVVRTSDLLLSELKDAETVQRGFLLTGDEKYLAPYQASLLSTDSLLRQSKRFSYGDSLEQVSCARLEKLIEKQLFLLKDGISKRRLGQISSAHSLDRGKILMDSIRYTVNMMQLQERDTLSKSISDKKRFSAASPFLICIAGIISLVISLIFFEKTSKSILSSVFLQRKLESQKAETAERIAEINYLTMQIGQGNFTLRINSENNEGINQLAVSVNNLAEQLEFSFAMIGRERLVSKKINRAK